MTELDDVWSDDLLGRRAEADMIADYVKSASERIHQDKANFSTLAIDAHYGEGKTFFLRKLTEHLRAEHPIAFVDAWADDLVDEPLTALAATIEVALTDLLSQSPKVRENWNAAKRKAGRIAAITAKGLLKRGVGLLITAGAVEAASEVLSGASLDLKDALKDDLLDVADASRDQIFDGSQSRRPILDGRIAEFKEGQKAVSEFKESLSALVKSVAGTSKSLPIIIVIDELDRCKPTYAIKLLEEIKHLLDVPGLFFIFGLHSDQLARAVSGVYGESFNGSDYLKRFVNRTYSLARPPLEKLIETLLANAGLTESRLIFPNVRVGEGMPQQWTPAKLIAEYMRGFELRPRDAYLLIDLLQTCAGLTGDAHLFMPFLLPYIFMKMEKETSFPNVLGRLNVKISFAYHDYTGHLQSETPASLASELHARMTWDLMTLQQDRGHHSDLLIEWHRHRANLEYPLASPSRYPELVEALGRFSQPSD